MKAEPIKTRRGAGRGRPRNKDRAEIIAHFAKGRDNGLTIGEIAARGLGIYEYVPDPSRPGNVIFSVRKYRGPTFERRYREFLDEVRQAASIGREVRFVREGATLPPLTGQQFLSFPAPKAVRRGRPKGKSIS